MMVHRVPENVWGLAPTGTVSSSTSPKMAADAGTSRATPTSAGPRCLARNLTARARNVSGGWLPDVLGAVTAIPLLVAGAHRRIRPAVVKRYRRWERHISRTPGAERACPSDPEGTWCRHKI